MLHGSSSQYIIFRSSKCYELRVKSKSVECHMSHLTFYLLETKRPIHSPTQASIKAAIALAAKAEEDAANAKLAAEDEKRTAMSKTFSSEKEAAPRSADGELVSPSSLLRCSIILSRYSHCFSTFVCSRS